MKNITGLERQIANMQTERKNVETKLCDQINQREKRHQLEILQYTDKLKQVNTYFPQVEELLPIVADCREIGFTEDMTRMLVNFQPVKFSGKLYSKEHNRKFETTHSTATVEEHPQQKGKFRLCIDGLPLLEWFKRKFQELKERLGLSSKRNDEKPQFRMKR